MEEKMMVEFQQAALKLKDFCIEPISMELPASYIIGIEGLNGAGKSTLIKMLLGRYENMSGRILIDGMDVVKERVAMLSRTGYIAEDREFFLEYNSYETEEHYSRFYENWNSEIYREMLKRFGVPKGTKIGALSKGNFIKFQMAFASAHLPKLMVLDEPMEVLDPAFRMEFVKWMQDMVAEYEMTFIISSHIKEELEKVADYMIHVKEGKCTLEEVVR